MSALVRPFSSLVLALVLAVLTGCSSSAPAPQTASPPAAEPQSSGSDLGAVPGGDDSASVFPDSPDALYRYRFRQISPGSDRFTFQDRELSFYFTPAPSALNFQVENRQARPVWIEWERSTFYPPVTASSKVAHQTTRWAERFRVQTATQIPGLQRYRDYVLPMDYLLEPAGADEQAHKPLFPEDNTAPQYEAKEFGVDLVFRIEDQLRTYNFRFRVQSVLPR